MKAPLTLRGSVIVVPLIVSGPLNNHVISAAVDTGAGMMTIPHETALSIGCNPDHPLRRVEIVTASGTEYVPVVKVPRVDLLGLEIQDVEAACLNLPPKSPVFGLLGLNVLSRFDVLLAFRRNFLELS